MGDGIVGGAGAMRDPQGAREAVFCRRGNAHVSPYICPRADCRLQILAVVCFEREVRDCDGQEGLEV